MAAVSGSLVSLELSLDGPSPSIVLTDGSLSCTDTGLSVLPFDTTGAATCPAGTSGEVHDQEGDSITVFVKKQCAPCGPGYQCAAGAAAGCSAGRYNPLLGAFAAAQCITCPAYSTSGPGEPPSSHLLLLPPPRLFPCRTLFCGPCMFEWAHSRR